jgi:hypothetical protein
MLIGIGRWFPGHCLANQEHQKDNLRNSPAFHGMIPFMINGEMD